MENSLVIEGQHQSVPYRIIQNDDNSFEVWIEIDFQIEKPTLLNLTGKPLSVFESSAGTQFLYDLESTDINNATYETKYIIQLLSLEGNENA